jgi:hypothetical protein
LQPIDDGSGVHPIDIDIDSGHSAIVSRLSPDAPPFDFVSGDLSGVAEVAGRP